MNPVKWTASLIKTVLNLSRTMPARGEGLALSALKSCELNGKVYPHGSEAMEGAMIRRCVDGQWQELLNPFITVGP